MTSNCTNSKSRNLRGALAASSALTAMAAAFFHTGSAYAQASAADEDEDRIVVTGSRIKRDGFESLQPTIVIDKEALDTRAVVKLADALNEQASFGIPGAAPIGGQSGTNVGQNQVNFLGLGSSRTLTLVNSKRFVSSNSASNAGSPGLQVDLNTIPLALVDRIETIAVGGAPIYGADAIAGTVNIILRDDFEGLDLSVHGGLSPDYGDAERFRVSAVAGSNFADGRGNVTVAFDYSTENGLKWTDRPKTAGRGFSFEAPADPTSPNNLILIDNATVAITDPDGLPLISGAQFAVNVLGAGVRLDPSDPTSPLTQFDANGNLVPFIPGGGTASLLFRTGGDGSNTVLRRNLYNDLDRYNGNLFLRYDLTDNVRLKAEGWYSRVQSTELLNEAFYQGAVFAPSSPTFSDYGGGQVPVLFSNPFVTAQAADIIGQATDFDSNGSPDLNIDTTGDGIPDAAGFWVDREFTNIVGDSPESSRQELFRTVAGVEGEFNLGGRDFNWDVSYVFGQARSRARSSQLVRDRFVQATNVVLDPMTGQPACSDPSDGCVPINVMAAAIDPAAVAFVLAENSPSSVNTQHYWTASVSGPVFTLPAGAVEVALGFDYRVEKARFTPGLADQLGLFDFQSTPISGSFNSKEFSGEALIPVVSSEMGVPLVERLEIEGAIRYVDHSIAGGDITWTGGGRYSPVEGVEFRGNVTHSIRAPSATELFLPETQIAVLADDPCDARYIDQGNFPERRAANCAADGIMQPFASVISDATQLGTASGNQSLLNETARAWTAGIILRPRIVPDLSIAADWINIDIENAIESLGGELIMQTCYDSVAFPDEPACESFTRNAAGQIASIRTGYVNVGRIEFSGLNLSVNYALPETDFGRFNLSVNHLYTDELTFTTGVGNPDARAGEIGVSKHRITGAVNWRLGKFGLSNQVRWLSGAAFDTSDGPTTRDVPRVPSWWTLNTAASYAVTERITLQVNADNLLNKKAPYGVPQTFGANFSGLATYYDGIRGRYLSFTARASF